MVSPGFNVLNIVYIWVNAWYGLSAVNAKSIGHLIVYLWVIDDDIY